MTNLDPTDTNIRSSCGQADGVERRELSLFIRIELSLPP